MQNPNRFFWSCSRPRREQCSTFLWAPEPAVIRPPGIKDSPDATGGISGIIALATDDMLHGGDQHHLDKMDILRTRYKLGKYTWGTGRFAGKDFILQDDGSLIINQAFYVDEAVKPVTISRERKRRRFSPCTELEITELRALIGSLAWLAKETRCDLAQQAFPRPLVRDLIFANKIAADAVEHKDIGVHLTPIIEFSRLRVGVVTDASWGNSKEMGAQLESTSLDTWKEWTTAGFGSTSSHARYPFILGGTRWP